MQIKKKCFKHNFLRISIMFMLKEKHNDNNNCNSCFTAIILCKLAVEDWKAFVGAVFTVHVPLLATTSNLNYGEHRLSSTVLPIPSLYCR